jgi:probable phosphoglycerate mutase
MRTPIKGAGHERAASSHLPGEHGETAWTISRQHTGTTDLPLTARASVRPSDSQRGSRVGVRRSAHEPVAAGGPHVRAGGFGLHGEVEPDLMEWNYGAYEGRTSAEIHAERPAGSCSATAAQRRVAGADRGGPTGSARVRAIEGTRLLFSSAHFLRVFAAPAGLGSNPGGQVLPARNGQSERGGVRARSIRAGHPTLGRDAAREREEASR